MTLSLFNNYEEGDVPNYRGLNDLSVMFTVLFIVISIFLAGLVNDNRVMNYICSMTVFGGAFGVILAVEFDFNDMSAIGIISVAISAVYTCILIPLFIILSKAISDESMNEA